MTLRNFFSPARPLLLAVAWLAGGCELVLGDLPPVKHHADGGGGDSAGGGGPGTGGACCDCDGDTHAAAGPCGGTDCDDGDPRAYLGETVYYAEASATPGVGFDWDCSGAAEQDPALLQTVDCQLIGLPCAAGTGYLAKVPPPCGVGAPWGTCQQDGIQCVPAIVEQSKVMRCK